jgi:hypothetical protein
VVGTVSDCTNSARGAEVRPRALRALSVTMVEEPDMASAATRGVT